MFYFLIFSFMVFISIYVGFLLEQRERNWIRICLLGNCYVLCLFGMLKMVLERVLWKL